MDKFTLTINLGNDAMQDELDVARALEKVADSLRRGQTIANILDDNGNRVGLFQLS